MRLQAYICQAELSHPYKWRVALPRGLTIEGAWGIQTPRCSPNALLGTPYLIGYYHLTLAISDLTLVPHKPLPLIFVWRLACTTRYVAPGTKDRPVEGAEAHHQEVQQETRRVENSGSKPGLGANIRRSIQFFHRLDSLNQPFSCSLLRSANAVFNILFIPLLLGFGQLLTMGSEQLLPVGSEQLLTHRTTAHTGQGWHGFRPVRA